MKTMIHVFYVSLLLAGCSTVAQLWTSDSQSTDAEKNATEGAATETATDSGENASSDAASTKAGDVGGKQRVKSMNMEELELKQAKLWARVDTLEEQTNRQRERMRVLEKGLLLGLIPEELKDDVKPKAKTSSGKGESSSKPAVADSAADGSPAEARTVAPAVAVLDKPATEDNSSFEERMAAAQDFFRAGRYGRAIAEYSAIGKEFKQLDQNGSHQFWIALSWLNLKEVNAAQQNFESFLREYPVSPWVVRAHFYLARVETQIGMREKSLQRLRRIISDYPNEDVAEMAKMEISNMGKTL